MYLCTFVKELEFWKVYSCAEWAWENKLGTVTGLQSDEYLNCFNGHILYEYLKYDVVKS